MSANAELMQLRLDLDKALSSDASVEDVNDMIRALSEVDMTLDMLRSTKIGVTVAAVKKKFPDSDAGNLARDMIAKWKCLVPARTEVASSNLSEAAKVATKLTTIVTTSSTKSSNADDDDKGQSSNDPRYDALSEARKKIVVLLGSKLKMSTTESNASIADFMACTIEAGIHNMFDAETDKANYATKVRSLVFNLKSNETLRRNIISGVLDAENVVHLTPAQLASEEKIKEAEKMKEDAVAERRGDWHKIARDQMMIDNGLDPNAGGEFQCKKCKGRKTTHYSMQTRSADEPMTVFVCCLGCGNRWRTQ